MNAFVRSNENIAGFFDKAPFAVTAICRNGEIGYVNKPFSDTFGGTLPTIGKISADKPCTKYISTGGISYRLYTIPAEDSVFVLFLPGSGNGGTDTGIAAENTFAAVRNAVSEMIITADVISRDGLNPEATEHLNLMEGFIMGLHSKVCACEKTEEIFSKSEEDFETVNISEKVREYSSELVRALSDYPTKVTVSSQGGLFSNCDFDAVRLLISDFAGRALEYKQMPESLDISLSGTPENRIIFSVLCKFCDPDVIQYGINSMDKIRSELASALNQKCGCAITEHTFGNALIFTVDMPECFGQNIIKAPSAHIVFDRRPNRFGDINSSLRAHSLNPEYPKRKEKENEE